jgi:uncharacterized protein with FMN-binding domain
MRRVIFAIISTAAALVFLLSFKSHSTSGVAASPPAASAGPAPAATAPAAPASANGGSASAGNAGSSGSGGGAGNGSAAASTAAKTVTGDVAQTFYGPVQVQITVRNGKVTAANAIEYPSSSPRDAQINAYAIPALNQEVLTASSAQIDAISGATFTSEGYITSLQSALNKAGL